MIDSAGEPICVKNAGWMKAVINMVYTGVRTSTLISSTTVALGATRKLIELPKLGHTLSSSMSAFFLSLSYCLVYTNAGI